MLGMLVAYDAEGKIIATLSHLVARDEEGRAIGLVDFEAWEKAGNRFRIGPDRVGIWDVPGAVGSGAWPEHLGENAHKFRVEVQGGRIERLVHAESGHKRVRKDIEKEIDKRMKAAKGEPVDLRDLVGGPGRAVRLDGEGRVVPRDRPRGPGNRHNG